MRPFLKSIVRSRPAACGVLILLAALVLAGSATAQSEEDLNDFPPPIKTLSKEERKSLEGEKDNRKRSRLAVDLMEGRLRRGEELSRASSFRAMFFELGVFQGLMEDNLRHLQRTNRGTGRDLDNFKRFELALRLFSPRIEILRRESPTRYEGYLMSLLKGLRDARSEAVKPLFGDSVIPDRPNRGRN